MDFEKAIPSQYPTAHHPHFAEFLNDLYANNTTASAVKHVSFVPIEDEVGPITSLVDKLTWDSTKVPAVIKLWYKREVSEEVRQSLKENGFEECLVRILQATHEEGTDVELDAIPKDRLFLLHAFAISPCSNISMLTLPSEWYAHTEKATKQELQACFPALSVGLRVSNENHTLFRIGGLENYSASSSIEPVQASGLGKDDFLARPRCVRCKKMKKGCNRERPCNFCIKAGLSARSCKPEHIRYCHNGRYGGQPGKGKHPRTLVVDTNQDDVEENTTGDTGKLERVHA